MAVSVGAMTILGTPSAECKKVPSGTSGLPLPTDTSSLPPPSSGDGKDEE